jgi:hypothetical protein
MAKQALSNDELRSLLTIFENDEHDDMLAGTHERFLHIADELARAAYEIPFLVSARGRPELKYETAVGAARNSVRRCSRFNVVRTDIGADGEPRCCSQSQEARG